MKTTIHSIFLCICIGTSVHAQTYDTNNPVVETFAGSGFSGEVDGQGGLTMFDSPTAIAHDDSGNLFILDSGADTLREIDTNANVTTLFKNALLSYSSTPEMAMDHSNILWLVTDQNEMVRIVPSATGSIISVPCPFSSCDGICVDSQNRIYISCESPSKIYRYTQTNGAFEVFAGSGNYGAVDGNGIFCSFEFPETLACDKADNIYVWDSGNELIRKIDQNRNVTTIAGNGTFLPKDGHGTNAGFGPISGLAVDQYGNLIISEYSDIRKLSPQLDSTTIAGKFNTPGFADGIGSQSQFYEASGLSIVGNSIFVADEHNQRIREITFDPQPVVLPPSSLSVSMFPGVTINGVVGRTYQIQSSTDMSNWSNEASVLLNQTPYLWIDHSGTSGAKFYRALLMP